jgi:large subunit ribosomal protein L35
LPKLKTHKSTARRFHITGSGKIMRTRGGKSHLRRKKSDRAKRDYDEMFPVSKADKEKLRKLLPYGLK